jgi:DNA-binding NarL/FixJ family response regulator
MGGVLVLSRAVELHTEIKEQLEELGFKNITVTDKENEELNKVICNKNPRLVIIDSWFYQDGTSCRIGELVKLFPGLNIAVVSVYDFPANRAQWFIWDGAKSYLNLWEGSEEFQRGLRILREGGQYISPKVQRLIDHRDEWPDKKNKTTNRQKVCLIMLCCGCIIDQIGETLHISKKTVYNHLNSLYSIYHVSSRSEMVALAFKMGLVTPEDIQLYNRKKEGLPLHELAGDKRKYDRFYFD